MENVSSYDEDLMALNNKKIEEYVGAIVYTLFVIVFGILGNIMSIMFYGSQERKTFTYVIISWLSTVDLIASILFSDEIIELCFTVSFKNKAGCKVMYFLNHWVAITSGFMLLFVAVDRNRKISKPFGWQISIKSAKITLLIIVMTAMVHSVRDLVIIDVVHVNVTEVESRKITEAFYCTHSRDEGLKTAIRLFHALDLLTFLLDFVGCIVLYILISRVLWLSRKQFKLACKMDGCSTDDLKETARTSQQTHDTVNSTTPNELVPLNPDEFSNEKLEFCEESKPSEAGKTLNDATFNGNNDSKDNKNKHQYSKRSKQYHVERKLSLMMIIITIASLLSFVPYFVVILTMKQNLKSNEQEFNVGIQIALRSYMINNAINPYIIGLFNSKFRQFINRTVCKCFPQNKN